MKVCPCGMFMHFGIACLGCDRLFCHQCLDVVGLCLGCAERDGNERGLGPSRREDDE